MSRLWNALIIDSTETRHKGSSKEENKKMKINSEQDYEYITCHMHAWFDLDLVKVSDQPVISTIVN